MNKNLWGKTEDGKEIYTYIIKNNNGMSAKLMNYSANLLELHVPDKDGKADDVVLGYKNLEDYFNNPPCFGCCVTPHANRIGGASFTLNGITYELDKNDGNNNLHSGFHPLFHRVWDVSFLQDDGSYTSNEAEAVGNTITFSTIKADMEMGFPGNLTVRITYTLCDDNSLRIDYYGLSDKDTVFNPTNHSYFNLSGHNSGTILNDKMVIYAEKYAYGNEESIPEGTLRDVAGTPMDFRKPKAVGTDIEADFDSLNWAKGYDQSYVINEDNDGTMTKAATLFDPKSKRNMDVFTTLPGVHVYTANWLDPSETGKEDAHYNPRDGICFETNYYPNSINVPSFPQPVAKAGVPSESTTIYKFY